MNQNPLPSPQPPTRDLAALEDEITELAAHLNAATYRLLALIREFDERHGWSGAGMKSCAHWLNWKCGIDLGAAREKVRVAHALDALPQISAALRGGRVSFSKVRAMTRVATPQNEDYLLMIAGHGTASHVERLVRNYRRVKRSEALARSNQHHALRELTWYIDDDGSYMLKARIADHYLSSEESAVTGGDRCTLHIHTDMNTLQADGDGGETRLDNLLLLCRHHHRLVHEGGYGLAMPVGGEPVFTTPNGRLIPGGPDTRFRGNVFALITGNRRERVEIGGRTGVPYWCGERMDDGMAVEGLVRRE